MIGVYWTLRPLKDSIFIQLVGRMQLPYAKTVSVLALLPLVMFYTKLLENISREKMLILLPSFYGTLVLVFAGVMLLAQDSAEVVAQRAFMPLLGTRALGYLW